MATRIKTIEYAIPTVITTLAQATNRTLTPPTQIFIPESSIIFRSVVLFVDCTHDGTAASNVTSPTVSIQLGAAGASSLTLVNPLAQSNEKEAWIFTRDVTSYFTTNWVGTGMTWSVVVNFSTSSTANHAVKLVITYEYDDTSVSHVKTIRIPIESTRTQLTTSFQTVGGATAIPALKGGYLPEQSITIRQIFIELWGNNGTAATTDFTTQYRVNAGTPVDFWRSESALNSAVWAHGIGDITNEDLSVARSFEMIVNGVTNRQDTFGGIIVCTYEFVPVLTTTVYNSLLIGAVETSGWVGGTTSADEGVWERNIYIEEPDTLTLKESGIALFSNDQDTYTLNVRVSGDTTGQTSYTGYVNTAGTLQCGCYSFMHRIDSGGQNGASGISLKRGKNLYQIRFYSGTAQAGWNLSGYLLLNYTSGKHTDGVGAHSHSVYEHVTDNITAAGSRTNTSVTVTPYIPETYYYLLEFLFYVNYNIGATTDINFTVDAQVTSGDTTYQSGKGWETIYSSGSRSDNENMNGWIYAAARNSFKRWIGDPDPNRLDIRLGRRYRLSNGALWTGSMGYWYTYNSITYTVSGTCTGYSGDGSGITIDIFRYNTTTDEEHVLRLTTTTGGVFTGQFIDNTDTLYAVAYQDPTHVGRSVNGTAT